MASFNTVIKKFGSKGEKSGWTYIEIPEAVANAIKPGTKKGFQVKGKLDDFAFSGLNLLPMGDGNFILALNAGIRKAIKKQRGASVAVQLSEDKTPYQVNRELLECLADDPVAQERFQQLPPSHKNYYSRWVESAKTEATKAKRIATAVRGLADGLDYGEMLRRERDERRLLGK